MAINICTIFISVIIIIYFIAAILFMTIWLTSAICFIFTISQAISVIITSIITNLFTLLAGTTWPLLSITIIMICTIS